MRETDRLLEVIRGRSAKSVGLQFPVGLRTKAVELAQTLEREAGVLCLVSADPSFGACDVPDMPVDLTVHLGHAPMPHLRYDRVFFFDLGSPPLTDYRFLDAAIARARDAQTFGIIVTRKIGQSRMEMAQALKGLAEKRDRHANIFLMDLVSPELLEGYRVDAWVNTACPRIAIEDILQYKQPVLTPQEFEIVLGERTWNDYVFDEIRA